MLSTGCRKRAASWTAHTQTTGNLHAGGSVGEESVMAPADALRAFQGYDSLESCSVMQGKISKMTAQEVSSSVTLRNNILCIMPLCFRKRNAEHF